MNKNGNDIFVGQFNVSDDGCDVDGRSESNSDSSSSEGRSKRFSRRITKVHTTLGSSIALQPDAFRGAMNPEEVRFRNNGMLQNPEGDNNQDDSGNGLNISSRITLKKGMIHRRMDQEMKRLRFIGSENITCIAKVEAPNVEELNTSVADIITCFPNF